MNASTSNLTPKNIGLAIGLFALCLGAAFLKDAVKAKYPKPPTGPVVTFEKVGRVKVGMTPDQVQAIFGARGWTSTPTPDHINEMQWFNSDYTGVGVFFQNGHVINTARIGALPQEDTGE